MYFQWRLLEMSGVERRRLFCAVLFHCVAALCVMWSLFVLIERAVEEVNRGLIGKKFNNMLTACIDRFRRERGGGGVMRRLSLVILLLSKYLPNLGMY